MKLYAWSSRESGTNSGIFPWNVYVGAVLKDLKVKTIVSLVRAIQKKYSWKSEKTGSMCIAVAMFENVSIKIPTFKIPVWTVQKKHLYI